MMTDVYCSDSFTSWDNVYFSPRWFDYNMKYLCDVSKGEDCPRANPNVEEVRFVAIAALKLVSPDVLKEPWIMLLRKAEELWGEPLKHNSECPK